MLKFHNSVGDLLRVYSPHSEAAFRVVADYIRSLAPDTTFGQRGPGVPCEAGAGLSLRRPGGNCHRPVPGVWRDYFRKEATTLGLSMQVLVHYKGPWRSMKVIPWRTGRTSPSRRDQAVQIVHSDRYFPAQSAEPGWSIYTVDRQAQLEFLSTLPNTYLWSAPIPADLLERYHLRQIPVRTSPIPYCDAPGVPSHAPANALKPVCCKKYARNIPNILKADSA